MTSLIEGSVSVAVEAALASTPVLLSHKASLPAISDPLGIEIPVTESDAGPNQSAERSPTSDGQIVLLR